MGSEGERERETTLQTEGVGEEGAKGVANAFHLTQLNRVGRVQVLLQHRDRTVHRGEEKLVARQNRTGLSWREKLKGTEGFRERVKNALGVS